ncbi:augmin complex subunit msd1 [Drosophila tropicalis]|uniref:augmin complex subunit msd1 n=1 Tax=Drosophila tropicalis TaxID=46794 RepID=UPI0035AB728B
MSELIDEILAGLDISRQTMQHQVTTINEILEKSNKTLLLVEENNNNSSSSSPAASDFSGQRTVNYKSEYEQFLAKILVNYHQLVQHKSMPNTQSRVSVLDDCFATQQRVEYLGNSVRKLKALCDTIQQIRTQAKDLLQFDEEEHDDSDKENEDVENSWP